MRLLGENRSRPHFVESCDRDITASLISQPLHVTFNFKPSAD